MAEKILQTRIINKHTTYEVANSNDSFIPKLGEIVLAKLDVKQHDGQSVPTFLMKVGDGEKTLKNLNWMHAPASDVYSWAKQEAKPAYTATEITRGSSTVSADLLAAEQAIQSLQTAVGSNGSVANQIKAAIEALDVDASTDADGVVISSISEADGKISVTRRALTDADIADLNVAMAKVTGLQAALDAKADKTDVQTAINGINTRLDGAITDAIADAKKAGTDAKTYAEGVAKDLSDYETANNAEVAAVRAIAEAARTEDEVNGQIDAKITAYNRDTVNPIAADVAQAKKDIAANATAISGLETGKVAANAKAIEDLAKAIGDVANVMNFRGVSNGETVGADIADPKAGDVIIFGEAEYVYDESGAWVKFGDASDNAAAISAIQGDIAKINTKNGEQDTAIQANATAASAAQKSADDAQSYAEGVADDLADEVARATKAESDNLATAKTYAEEKASAAQTAAEGTAKSYTDGKISVVNQSIETLGTTVSTNAQTAANATAAVAKDLADYETANDAALDVVRTNAQKGVDDAASALAYAKNVETTKVDVNTRNIATNAADIDAIEKNFAKVKANGSKFELVVGENEDVIIFDCGGIE